MRMTAQVGLAYFTLLVVGALWRLLPAFFVVPDLVALFAVYLGLTARAKLAPSVATAVIIGYLADLIMGAPVGIFALTAGLVCTVGHLIQGRLLVRGTWYTIIFSALTVLVAGLVVLILRATSGLLPSGFGAELVVVIKSALLTGLLGPLVFRACRLVDSRFARTPRERDAASTGVIS